MKKISKIIPAMVVLLLTGFITGLCQQNVPDNEVPVKVIRLHLLDLVRIYSPAIKASYEVMPNNDYSQNYEAGLISDFYGNHYMSNFNFGKIKFVNGVSVGFYPMVRINKYDFAGFRINYSLKYREINDWVARFGGAYLQELDFWHLTNSLGFYYRYASKQRIVGNIEFSLALNAGILGSYIINDLPDDVVPTSSNWEQMISSIKPAGFHVHPHVYLEINIPAPFPIGKTNKN